MDAPGISPKRDLGPVWAGYLFEVHMDFPFLSSAGIMLVGLRISLVWMAPEKTENLPVRPQRV